jgi:uncharacterized protein
VRVESLPVPAPSTNPETRPFWDAVAERRLVLPRCASCDAFIWYPRLFCPSCGGRDVEWVPASGRGVVYSFAVVRRGEPRAYEGATPYVVAYVDLEEGPRVYTNVVQCDPEDVAVGQEVEVVFETDADATLIRFRPRRPQAGK